LATGVLYKKLRDLKFGVWIDRQAYKPTNAKEGRNLFDVEVIVGAVRNTI